jgi:hypothetical protein
LLNCIAAKIIAINYSKRFLSTCKELSVKPKGHSNSGPPAPFGTNGQTTIGMEFSYSLVRLFFFPLREHLF